MIGDLDISGIFLPTFLVLMGIAYVIFLVVHAVLTRVHFTAWSGTGLCSTSVYTLCCSASWIPLVDT